MHDLDRRQFVALAAALGASAAWTSARARPSRFKWTERRDLFPQGVASGDPQADSVILWTRRPPVEAGPDGIVLNRDGAPPGSFDKIMSYDLTLEVAEDSAFQKIVATALANASRQNGWTTRVLVGGLKPSREYWYRFVGADGGGS